MLHNQDKIKLSIIIPVHNAEKFLKKCLDSVINQTLTEIEIICIDDGSNDRSCQILEAYSKFDSRVKIISQQNNSPGASRNLGLEISIGEYVGFVDSDDYIDLDYFEKLYNAAVRNNADIACAGIIRKRKCTQKYRLYYSKEEVFEKINDKLEACTSIDGSYVWNVWNKIYKKSFLENLSINFENLPCYEDVNFTIMALFNSNRLTTVPNVFYWYVVNNKSLVKSSQTKEKQLAKYNAHKKMLQYCFQNNIKLSDSSYIITKKKFCLGYINLLKRKELIRNEYIVKKYCLFDFFPIFKKKKDS